MSFRDTLRASIDQIRAIPDDFGVHPYAVAVEVSTWSGSERGEGTETITLTSVTNGGKRPHVRWMTDEEIAVGGFPSGTVEVNYITPDFPGGGTALSVLEPTLGSNATFRYILTGPRFPAGGRFRLIKLEHDRGFHYRVMLEKSGD